MMEYVKICFRKYATFSGRARRAEFWYFFLFLLPLTLLSYMNQYAWQNEALAILLGIIAIVVFIPRLAVAVRRLHDTNHSGWWILINLILFIGTIYYLYLLASEGDHGDNQYGPDPKAVEEI
ncbi:MAG: DUF805 domain-containing protein [Paludibacteraceae bacterium]|nr:DUF805 domain-containing protein [Paludibacteraceae bacterium]